MDTLWDSPVWRTARLALIICALCGASREAFAQQTANTTNAGQPAAPHLPQTAPPRDERRLTWSIIERVRYAGLINQFRPGLSGDDQALASRLTLRTDFALRYVTFVGELQDVRAYLTDSQSNVSTALIDSLDLLQAYARFGGGARGLEPGGAELQLGRFSMELGSGRLIAQEAYRDVTRAFTGAKVRWRPSRLGTLTALAVLPVLTLPDRRSDLLDNRVRADREHFNQALWGGLYERQLWQGLRGELYMYALREHDDPGQRETRDRRLWTPGVRLYRNPATRAWDLDAEFALQRGRARATAAASDLRNLDVSAHYLHAHGGYTWPGRWTPRLALEYEYGSGDPDPADGRWNRFDSLFGNRRVDLGPTSIYGALGRENIQTAGVRLSVAPTRRVDAFAVYRVVRLAAARDAFASTGVLDSTGRSGRDGGQQIDIRQRTWLVPGLVRLEVGATTLIAGHFLRHAPNATDEGNTTFFYADVTWTFGSK